MDHIYLEAKWALKSFVVVLSVSCELIQIKIKKNGVGTLKTAIKIGNNW